MYMRIHNDIYDMNRYVLGYHFPERLFVMSDVDPYRLLSSNDKKNIINYVYNDPFDGDIIIDSLLHICKKYNHLDSIMYNKCIDIMDKIHLPFTSENYKIHECEAINIITENGYITVGSMLFKTNNPIEVMKKQPVIIDNQVKVVEKQPVINDLNIIDAIDEVIINGLSDDIFDLIDNYIQYLIREIINYL